MARETERAEPTATGPDAAVARAGSLTRADRQHDDMETPQTLRAVDQGKIPVRKYEYDDGTVVVADFGGVGGDPSVDVVGRTAIVVGDDEQLEFGVPPEATDVSINGGVLTIDAR